MNSAHITLRHPPDEGAPDEHELLMLAAKSLSDSKAPKNNKAIRKYMFCFGFRAKGSVDQTVAKLAKHLYSWLWPQLCIF